MTPSRPIGDAARLLTALAALFCVALMAEAAWTLLGGPYRLPLLTGQLGGGEALSAEVLATPDGATVVTSEGATTGTDPSSEVGGLADTAAKPGATKGGKGPAKAEGGKKGSPPSGKLGSPSQEVIAKAGGKGTNTSPAPWRRKDRATGRGTDWVQKERERLLASIDRKRMVANRYTLYEMPNCLPCEMMANDLKTLGIPFDRRSVLSESAHYRSACANQATPQCRLPVLDLHGLRVIGYDPLELLRFVRP